MTDNLIQNNTCNSSGGGIRFCYFFGGLPRPEVERNLILDNSAADGAGIHCHETDSLQVRACVVAGNIAGHRGGGLMTTASGMVPRIELLGCTFHENEAHGLPASTSPPGGGFHVECGVVHLVNTIVSGHVGGGLVCGGDAAAARIDSDYCDVWNNDIDYHNCLPGPHSLAADPEFCLGGFPAAIGGAATGWGETRSGRPRMSDEEAPWFCIRETSPGNGTGRGGYDIGAGWVGCFSLDGVVFYDNFSDQHDDGWIVEQSWPGQVTVEEGEYSLRSLSGAARSRVADLAVEDFEWTVWLNPQETQLGGAHDFRFRLDPVTGDSYQIVIETELQRGALVRWEDEIGCIMAEFPCPVMAGGWNALALTAAGGHLEARWTPPLGWITELFTVEDPVPLGEGTVSLGVEWRAAPGGRGAQHTHFDRVMVREIEASAGVAAWADPARRAARVAPNPTAGAAAFHLPFAAAGLELFDAQGRLVRVLRGGRPAAGERGAATLLWDGRDAAGRSVPSGIYSWRLLGVADPGAKGAQGRVAVLR